MRFFYVAVYDFIKNIRNIKMHLFFLGFGFVVISILGNVLGGEFDRDFEKFKECLNKTAFGCQISK